MKGTIDLHDEWGWGVLNEANEWLPLHPDDLTYFAEMKERFDNFEARVLSSPEVEFKIIIHNKFTGKIIYAKLNTKEEPKQETLEEPTMIDDWLNEYGDPEIYKKVEKQLELEEAAENYAHNYFNMHETNNYKALKQGFEEGVKWQQERMYSEEDLEKAFKAGEVSMNRAILKDEGYDLNSYNLPNINDFEQWFEQFKKK